MNPEDSIEHRLARIEAKVDRVEITLDALVVAVNAINLRHIGTPQPGNVAEMRSLIGYTVSVSEMERIDDIRKRMACHQTVTTEEVALATRVGPSIVVPDGTPQAAYVDEMRPLGPDFEKVWDDNVDKLYENGTDNTPKECEHDWPIPSSEKHGYFIHCKKCIEPKWVVGEDGWLPAEQDGAA